MPEIKPDEISAILRQQLSGFNAGADLEEVGPYCRWAMVLPVFMVLVMYVQVNW
jgi:hypothetical protein